MYYRYRKRRSTILKDLSLMSLIGSSQPYVRPEIGLGNISIVPPRIDGMNVPVKYVTSN